MNKKTFKTFLYENGFPFLNVYNNEIETIFGHRAEDISKAKRDEDDTEDADEVKTKRKLNSYMRYAKNINEDELNVK